MTDDEILHAIRERPVLLLQDMGGKWAHGIRLTAVERRDLLALLAAKERQLAEVREELARWKVCENCGQPLAGPGICDRAISEREKGLEAMHEETLTRAEQAERERDEAREAAEQLGAKVDKAERLALQHYAAAEHAEAALAALQEKVE